MNNFYFDNAATSYPKPETVYLAVVDAMRSVGASPGRGGYRQSLDASRLLFLTRELVASLFGVVDASRIIFTHSATEALNLALCGVLKAGDHVVTSSMEHNSLIRPLNRLREEVGIEYTVIQASNNGYIDPEDVRTVVTSKTRMIAVAHVSNVCGVIQPIDELSRIARDVGALFLLDAAQSAGTVEIDVQANGIDLLAAPGHKGLYGPQGTGFLYVAPSIALRPILAGGTGTASSKLEQPTDMPEGFEAGTHNLPGIAGLKAGIEFVKNVGVTALGEHERSLVGHLAESLLNNSFITIHGFSDLARHNGVLSFNVVGKDPSTLAYQLDQRFKIAVRAGLHCAPGAHKTIGTFPAGTVRISPGWFTSDEDIAFVSDAIVQCNS